MVIGQPYIKWESISRIALGDSAERVHEKTDHLDNRLVFISALWVALTTAILCAILPAGLPLTKAVGSAFSPSTTIVALRSEEHTSELQSLMRISYAVFCLKKKTQPHAHK